MKAHNYIGTIVAIAITVYLLIVLITSFILWEWKETIYNVSCWDSLIRGWYISTVVTFSAINIIAEENFL